MCSSDMDLFFF